MLADSLRILDRVQGVRWSACVRVAGRTVAELDADSCLPTASIGKVLLLLEVARRIESGGLSRTTPLARQDADAVADSGLWQFLTEDAMSVESLAVLVGSVSDNLAANVLLREVGVDATVAVAEVCGLHRTRILDRIRDRRGPADPPAPSVGCAAELARLMDDLAAGEAVSAEASRQVARWLSLGVDASMVAGGVGLDPLAHVSGSVVLFNKTGWDEGVRADVGHVRGAGPSVGYAVLAHWDAAGADRSPEVLGAMRAVGERIGEALRSMGGTR